MVVMKEAVLADHRFHWKVTTAIYDFSSGNGGHERGGKKPTTVSSGKSSS
jgi:hypothetical protein